MRLRELVHFNSDEYRTRVASKEYSYADLAREIYKKRRAIVTAGTSIATSLACVHVSHGTSLVGTAWSSKNLDVEKRKLAILEKEWAACRQYPLPQRPIKDIIIPILITTTIGTLTFNVDLGLSNNACAAAYAAQPGPPGHTSNNDYHLIGACFEVLEVGMGAAGKAMNARIAGDSRAQRRW